jgi:hypothetical protein
MKKLTSKEAVLYYKKNRALKTVSGYSDKTVLVRALTTAKALVHIINKTSLKKTVLVTQTTLQRYCFIK